MFGWGASSIDPCQERDGRGCGQRRARKGGVRRDVGRGGMPGDGDVIEPRVQEDLVPFGPAGGLWDEKTLQEVHALFGDAEGAAGAKIDLQTGVLEVQEELAERILSGGSGGLEGRRAGEHLEEDDADGPEVDA